MFKQLLKRLKSWKPIHLCWWFKKHGWKIPKYLIGNPDDEGPRSPGTMADDAAIGTMAWYLFDRAKVADGSNTYINVGWGLPGTTHYLKATNFGFSIPTGATINGILVEIKHTYSISNQVNENEIKIVKADGSIGTTNKSTGAVPPSPGAYVSYGGPSDLWSESWSAENINDSDFGAVISFIKTSGEALVDHIRITVYYTEEAPSPNLTSRNNYNGYLAFIQQYIKHKVNETTPWKNPDGTLLE